MDWSIHHEGADPELDEIVKRRFGSRHTKACSDPSTLTCALWDCQLANSCRAHTRRRPSSQEK